MLLWYYRIQFVCRKAIATHFDISNLHATTPNRIQFVCRKAIATSGMGFPISSNSMASHSICLPKGNCDPWTSPNSWRLVHSNRIQFVCRKAIATRRFPSGAAPVSLQIAFNLFAERQLRPYVAIMSERISCQRHRIQFVCRKAIATALSSAFLLALIVDRIQFVCRKAIATSPYVISYSNVSSSNRIQFVCRKAIATYLMDSPRIPSMLIAFNLFAERQLRLQQEPLYTPQSRQIAFNLFAERQLRPDAARTTVGMENGTSHSICLPKGNCDSMPGTFFDVIHYTNRIQFVCRKAIATRQNRPQTTTDRLESHSICLPKGNCDFFHRLTVDTGGYL